MNSTNPPNGFDPRFISGSEIPLPALNQRIRAMAFNDGNPINHRYFSIIFNVERGFAICTAHNIDGTSILADGLIPRGSNFRFDPDVPNDLQVDNDRAYRNNPWDRGHMVRRRALHWGNIEDARQADSESFYYTNITPQHTDLHHSAWGEIENWMLGFADENDKRAAIFTGPVLTLDDPEVINRPGEAPIRIPSGFWKIMVIKHKGVLRAAGFLVWQRDFDSDQPLGFLPQLEQVRITTIEFLTGLSFGELRNADPLRFGEPAAAPAPPSALEEMPPQRKPSSLVGAPNDIYLG